MGIVPICSTTRSISTERLPATILRSTSTRLKCWACVHQVVWPCFHAGRKQLRLLRPAVGMHILSSTAQPYNNWNIPDLHREFHPWLDCEAEGVFQTWPAHPSAHLIKQYMLCYRLYQWCVYACLGPNRSRQNPARTLSSNHTENVALACTIRQSLIQTGTTMRLHMLILH